MDQKRLFIADYLSRAFSIVELCGRYGVSRPTAYKWIRRFLDRGYSGLDELPRRPSRCPHRTADELVQAILDLWRKHPHWGAKKLLKILYHRRPDTAWPARSTVSDILKRHGLVEKKRRKTYPGHPGKPLSPMDRPNEIWSPTTRASSRPGMGSTATR